MDKDEIDFYYLAVDYSGIDIDNHNVELSKVTSINSFNVGQMLRKPNKLDESDFSLFLIENIRILVLILIGYFFIVTAKFTLLKLIKRRASPTRCSFYNLFTIDQTRLGSVSFKIAALSLAFSLFLFFNLNILAGMIKTDKVTVDTSEFIDSVSKLNKTTKKLVTSGPYVGDLFYRLIKKRKRPDSMISINNFYFLDFFPMLSKSRLDSYFFFMNEIYMIASFYYLILFNHKSVDDYFIFFKTTTYYESSRAIFYRKNLDQKMKQILNRR